MYAALRILIATMALAALASCKSLNRETDVYDAKLRVVNTVNDSIPKQFIFNQLNLSGQITFMSSTGYQVIPALEGQLVVKIIDSLKLKQIADYPFNPKIGSIYTAFFTRDKQKVNHMLFLEDDLSKVDTLQQGKTTRLRFINLGPSFTAGLEIANNDGVVIPDLVYAQPSAALYLPHLQAYKIKLSTSSVTDTIIPAENFPKGKNSVIWFDADKNNKIRFHLMSLN